MRVGDPTTADASTGASASTSISMLVDSVGGVPDSGSSLDAVLVGGMVFTGSVGVAATCSVDGGSVGDSDESVDEQPTRTTDAMTKTRIERFMGPY